MAKKCPICGKLSLTMHSSEFKFEPPPNIPGGTIVIPHAKWQECSTCGEKIIPVALGDAIERERYHRLGLLTPQRIYEIRQSAGLTQTEMAQLLGVGDKTYTRWESGRSLQNKSSDNLIRAFEQNADLFARLEAQRNPERKNQISEYIESLKSFKAENQSAIAAHGSELDPRIRNMLRKRLLEIANSK